MDFIDTVTLGDARITRDGYLVTDAKIARTGIQLYAGMEVGRPDMDVVRVYRSEAEVFSKDSLASFAHRPVTVGHPDVMVTADNWKQFAVGDTGGDVARDGEYVRIPLTLMDKAAITAVQGGKRQLSAGYSCDLEWTAGKTPTGEAYDAMQVGIRANHLAVVDAARAGPVCRIGDGNQASQKEDDMTLQKVTVDGITVEMSDTAAQVVSKVQTQLADAQKAIDAAKTEHATALAAKDAELAKKDAAIDDLKAKVLDAKAIDARVAARADLIATAKRIAGDVKTDGLSDVEIRKAVVVAKLGDAVVKDKADAYIDARFDILAEGVSKTVDGVRQATINAPAPVTDAATAYEQMRVRDANAWRQTKETA